MAGHMSRVCRTKPVLALAVRGITTQTQSNNVRHFPVVVLGGGSGGCSMASRLCRVLGNGNVAVVDPAKDHVYQPLFTLVGAGIRNVHEAEKPMSDVLPKQCVHFQQRVAEFNPDASQVTLHNGQVLSYRHLVVALGIQIDYKKVDGLLEALKQDPVVCTNYWRATVAKTFPAIKAFQGGNAIFTYPNTPVKCAGAAQKIMYLADEYWRKSGVRGKTSITYNTAQDVIFQVKKYADQLNKVVAKKSITVNYMRNLTAIDHIRKEVTFLKLDSNNGETEKCEYDFIHVTPPMCAPEVMKHSKSPIVDETGFLDINKHTLQHVKYPNIFGVGDCTNLPTSKTAAAISSQSKVLARTIKELMADQKPSGKYDGYTSCPLLTGYKKCILAEFDYDKVPMETFPIDQSKERWSAFQMKNRFFPQLYWKGLVKGHWSGPKYYRKALHFGMSR